ncbi:hypothetical protein TNCV_2371641 [Trichonephila clavipes]|nr:hypothetical protein TNCV_2371641 [Trichonephila clavipes]
MNSSPSVGYQDRNLSREESVHEVGATSVVREANPESNLADLLYHVNEDTEFLDNELTVYYVEVITRLRKCIVRVRLAIANNWRLFNDNSSVSRSKVSCREQCGNVASSPYSPTLRNQIFFSVPKNKIDAQGETSRIGRGGSKSGDEWAKQHSGPGVPGGVRKLENSLASVYR